MTVKKSVNEKILCKRMNKFFLSRRGRKETKIFSVSRS